MSKSTEFKIKVDLDEHLLWCGNGSIGAEMGLKVNEKRYFTGDRAVEFMQALVCSTFLGNVHKQIILACLSMIEETDIPSIEAWLRD